MRKKSLSILTLILSFMLCFPLFNMSYADSISKDPYPIRSTVTVRDGGSTKTKACGTLNKGEKVNIIAFERNSTGSWWCKIGSGKYKGKWIYSGAIDFPYARVKNCVYSVSSDYSTINVRSSNSSSSQKAGTLAKNKTVTLKNFKKDSKGDWWGQISSGTYKNKWVYMKYMNFYGNFYTVKKNVPVRSNYNKNANESITIKSKNTLVRIKRIDLNSAGNWWAKIDSSSSLGAGKYVFLGNLSKVKVK